VRRLIERINVALGLLSDSGYRAAGILAKGQKPTDRSPARLSWWTGPIGSQVVRVIPIE